MALPLQFQKQQPMRSVCYALMPALIGSIYFFGWRSLAVVTISVTFSVLTEWLFVRSKNGKISEAAFVTGMLYGLILPPLLPFWMAALGAVFAITFGKMAFGGFGANIFNPAMVGRAFVYITFPVHMTNQWIPASDGRFPGGFTQWIVGGADALTAATSSHAFESAGLSVLSLWQLFLGNIHGTFQQMGAITSIGGGSIGESSALLLMTGGAYLLYKKIAKWRLVAGFFGTYFIFQAILFYFDPNHALHPVYALFSGGIILGGFFMVSDPVSAVKTVPAQWFYAGLIAVFAAIIRTYSLFAGGLMFAILLGNMFGPLIDVAVKKVQASGGSR